MRGFLPLSSALFAAALLHSPVAHAAGSSTMADAHVVIVDGKIWGAYTKGVNPAYTEFLGSEDKVWVQGDGIEVGYRIRLSCPDADEQVTKVKLREHGHSAFKTLQQDGGGFDTMGAEFDRKGTMSVPWSSLSLGAKKGVMLASAQVEWWCSPLVGTSTKRTMSLTSEVRVETNPPELPAKTSISQYLHVCPEGYEVSDNAEYGYGEQSDYSPWAHEECRRPIPTKVKPKSLPPKPKPKTAEETAVEKYHQTLAQADAALAVFRSAGIVTIHDAANTPLANLTSVLGIAQGKSVQAAAKKQVAANSVLDPNWRFDRHFLIDPTWFVDPRIRGTASAHNKIGTAQKKLVKLQKGGIVTLHHLASAKVSRVSKLAGIGKPEAQALVDAARKQTDANYSKPWAMAISRDWVIHPVWVIHPGYLPSVDIVRHKPVPASDAAATTAPPAVKPELTPPTATASTETKIDQKKAKQVSRVTAVSLDPASSFLQQGPNGSGRPKKRGPGATRGSKTNRRSSTPDKGSKGGKRGPSKPRRSR
jgi:hypothetical protein